MLAAIGGSALALLVWVYLLAGHGGYWRTDQRLPAAAGQPLGQSLGWPPGWPSVVAIVPARDEAAVLPATLPTLFGQDYQGEFGVVLVDDESSDGTSRVAAALGHAAGWADPADPDPADPDPADQADPDSAGPASPRRGTLRIVSGAPTPAGWAGKVWAMAQGLQAAGDADYVLFTDADIAYRPGSLATLVRAAEADHRVLVSQMVLLRADTGWERLLVPAFVYFFAQLYPFRRVNRPGARTAAAAGGCMLVRRRELAAAGGLEGIRGALIDDVALGRLIKAARPAGRCWLGLTTDITSIRPYRRLPDLWDMVARSAYTQLRYSPAALAGTVIGLAWIYVLPPAAAIGGLLGIAAGGGGDFGWIAPVGLVSWAVMTITYVPMLRLYGLSPLRAPCLPLIAALYAAMTVDSARRHYRGRGGEWKGRVAP
jgi:hopene-associated glycosyltransferase HpnB